jgi:hypothetical protein
MGWVSKACAMLQSAYGELGIVLGIRCGFEAAKTRVIAPSLTT